MSIIDDDWGGIADETAKDTAKRFWYDAEGAHMTSADGDATTGGNTLIHADGMDVRDGTIVVAYLHGDGSQIGPDGAPHVSMDADGVDIWCSYVDAYGYYHTVKALSMTADASGARIRANGSLPLWLRTDGMATLSGDTVRLRGATMTIADENGTHLWQGSAQDMADALSGSAASGPKVYAGSIVKQLGSTSITNLQIWDNATFRSTFNVKSGSERVAQVFLNNANQAAGNLGVVGAEYRSNGWNARWTTGATGGKEFGYLVVVPESAQA